MAGGPCSRTPQRDRAHDLRAFVAAGERLLFSGQDITDEALDMCRKMLASARSDTGEQRSLWAVMLHRHHDELEVLLDSNSLWQMAATSRCFSVDFQDRARKDLHKLHGIIHEWRMYGPQDLVSPQANMYHSPLMWHVLNGKVEEVKFMLQLGIDVNQAEQNNADSLVYGCDMCRDSRCKLLEYTFWEVAVIMATSKPPSLRRRQVRDLMRQHGGGHLSRSLPSKRRFLRYLHEPVGYEEKRCRLAEARDIEDSDKD